MKEILILLYLVFGYVVNAQIIDNRGCKAFTDDPFFDIQFIKKNKVKSITGSISTKTKYGIITPNGLTTYFDFDKDGKQVTYYNTFHKGNSFDTTVVKFTYNDSNKLLVKRRNDNYGFYSYTYSYDSSGNKTGEKYCRDENLGASKHEFKLGKQYIIIDERYKVEQVSATQKKVVYFNNYGKSYQEKLMNYDKKGYLISEEKTLLRSKKKNKTEYEYDYKGYVIKKTETSSVAGNFEEVHEYEYDKIGNLTSEKIYRNGKHKTTKTFLYYDTMLLKAIILKDISSENLTITKYKYQHHK